ncbi:transcriptional regulator [Acrocarpospora corrugata]|uniref:Transcriptional regulator n=1 Tax=Acrocarpospora corrugata TaxID=35763 RepID=A0A5M3VZT1_9ACTN|nr:WYL domain-containing protein [Acrocarpospora corrugata]GES02345.1 transcriptional regulator [Acrocarpospora corrugata]
MNRTDRLYAIVELLRAVSPRPRSARELGERFAVTARTIERDILALQEAQVPIYAERGRLGGYVLDRSMSLPPLNFSPEEAVAIAIALNRSGDQPFADQARSAMRKLMAAMPAADGDRARELAGRVQLLSSTSDPEEPEEPCTVGPLARVIEGALLAGVVLELEYGDVRGAVSRRVVEPGVFVGGRGGVWYLVAWCRLRDDVRVFRLDRIRSAEVTAERVPARRMADFASHVPDMVTLYPALD